MSREFSARFGPAAGLVVVLWGVTFAHHVYGGLRFDSPYRVVAGVVFTAVLGVTLWLGWLGQSRRWARAAYLATVVLFWIVAIGLYEGGYNHALYLILEEAAPGVADQLYGADSDAKLSQDALFQATGVLTLIVALAVAAALPRSWTRQAKPLQTQGVH